MKISPIHYHSSGAKLAVMKAFWALILPQKTPPKNLISNNMNTNTPRRKN